jgi:hypothetical protein
MPDPSRPDPAEGASRASEAPNAAPNEAAEDTAAPSPKGGHAGGFTLDLSSGTGAGPPEAWRRKRKQASPILTKIVDLTAPKPAPPEAAAPSAAKPPAAKPAPAKAPREERRERRDNGKRGTKPGGATLADLLDEETLARLRRTD